MEKMIIRRAVREDATAISALIHDLLPWMTLEPDGTGAEQFIMSMSAGAIERYVSGEEYQYWSGWIGEELVGVVALRGGTHLFHLFVGRRYHGRGWARELWQSLGAAAVPGMTVNASLHALPMYEHFGFVATGPRIEEHGIAFVPMRLA